MIHQGNPSEITSNNRYNQYQKGISTSFNPFFLHSQSPNITRKSPALRNEEWQGKDGVAQWLHLQGEPVPPVPGMDGRGSPSDYAL